MNKHIPAKTIIQQIQPQCDNLHIKMKHQKDAQHETNQSVADATGIPISNVAKFFSGSLTNPSVFYVAAICIYLGLSLDELIGIAPEKEPESQSQIAELKAKLDGAEKQVELLKERSKLLEAGIKERKPVIYGLAGLCIFLSLVFVLYLGVDVSDPEHGFIRNNTVSPALIVLIPAIVVAALWTAHSVVKRKSAARNKAKYQNERR